jgi:hypothetical protein
MRRSPKLPRRTAAGKTKVRRGIFFLAFFLLASAPALANPWYEGGTLQRATFGEWKKASPANQLATAGDFSASLSMIPDIAALKPAEIAQLKVRAEELRGCVNQHMNDSETPDDKAVAELVVLCAIMKQKPKQP